ncbi:MAG: 3-phosphoserine/phosphohydroxythreonine transaminase [Succinivibrionaceae bacterium]
MSRVYNFSAGPSIMPEEVMKYAQNEFLDYQGIGSSIMEISHRSQEYIKMAQEAEKDLRDLLNIPDNYKVLFLQGGGRGQFAAVPMNLLTGTGKADYITTGNWSEDAFKEAQRYGDVSRIKADYTNQDGKVTVNYDLGFRDDVDYVYYCANETVCGIEMFQLPEVGDRTLVADISSNFLSKPMDVSKFGLLYAGAQKNVAPAGLTIVIVREDLIGRAKSYCPSIFDYKIEADKESMFNTPPTFCWYMAGLVFKWLKKQGGLEQVEQNNIVKAKYLYDYLDSTDFYESRVAPEVRSRMNVPFFLKNEELNQKFLAESKAAGLTSLKGHRILGGMRASIYNAMPFDGVKALVAFMEKFARENG